jgi:hypothetical protein
MIIGYSHVTLSSADLNQDAAWLESMGFERKFTEEGLVNDPLKGPYLATPADTMSMIFLEAPGSIAIELVSYERWADSSVGNYELLLESPAGHSCGDLQALDYHHVWGNTLSRDLGGGSVGSMNIPLSFARGSGETGGVLSIRSVTANVGRELEFWCSALGCCKGAHSGSAPTPWVTAEFASPVPQWRANLMFVEGDPVPHPHMDSPGSTCVSILVKDLQRTADTASGAGALSVSNSFEIEVDGKVLKIAIVRTPGGAIVELMEYQPGWSR